MQFLSKSVTIAISVVFIFGLGLLYAFIKPEEFIINAIFFIIGCGWAIFVIRYLWDFIDKKKKN